MCYKLHASTLKSKVNQCKWKGNYKQQRNKLTMVTRSCKPVTNDKCNDAVVVSFCFWLFCVCLFVCCCCWYFCLYDLFKNIRTVKVAVLSNVVILTFVTDFMMYQNWKKKKKNLYLWIISRDRTLFVSDFCFLPFLSSLHTQVYNVNTITKFSA